MPSLWNWTGRPRILPGMVNEADQDWAFDIPSIIMHDLGDHHRASYEFFNGDDNRVAYWAGEHLYTGDLSGIAAALDSASTDPSLTSAHKRETASIAARGLEAVAGREDFGVEGGQRGVEGAQSLEHILETYMRSLAATYANSPSRPESDLTYDLATETNQIIADSPWFSRETLDSILGVVGRDGQAFIDLRTAVNNAEATSLPPGSDRQALSAVANLWGSTEGAIANAIGTGGINEAHSNDEHAQAWIDLAGKPASTLAGLLKKIAPVGTVMGVGWVSDAFVNISWGKLARPGPTVKRKRKRNKS